MHVESCIRNISCCRHQEVRLPDISTYFTLSVELLASSAALAVFYPHSCHAILASNTASPKCTVTEVVTDYKWCWSNMGLRLMYLCTRSNHYLVCTLSWDIVKWIITAGISSSSNRGYRLHHAQVYRPTYKATLPAAGASSSVVKIYRRSACRRYIIVNLAAYFILFRKHSIFEAQ